MKNPDSFVLLDRPSYEVAPLLLGSELIRELDGELIRVKIVELEAYDQTDPASHSYRGKTASNSAMFGPSGHLYVYFTYGMHYCMNIVTGADGFGSGVLIRAVEPIEGIDMVIKNRKNRPLKELTNGPGKVAMALKIDKTFFGHNLRKSPLTLNIKSPLSSEHIAVTNRVGISKGKDTPWRFFIKDNSYVSRPNNY